MFKWWENIVFDTANIFIGGHGFKPLIYFETKTLEFGGTLVWSGWFN